jgi:hypothetical protein
VNPWTNFDLHESVDSVLFFLTTQNISTFITAHETKAMSHDLMSDEVPTAVLVFHVFLSVVVTDGRTGSHLMTNAEPVTIGLSTPVSLGDATTKVRRCQI